MSYHHLPYIHVYNYKVSSTRSSQLKKERQKIKTKLTGKTEMLKLQDCEGIRGNVVKPTDTLTMVVLQKHKPSTPHIP